MGKYRYGPLVVGLALGLTGCIHYEEEITLRANGSGEATLHYWMSSAMVNMGALLEQTDKAGPKFTEEAIRKDFEGLEGVQLTEVKLKEEGGNHHAFLKIQFEDVERLSALGREWMEESITFRRERGKLFFTRTLKVKATGPAQAAPTRSSAVPRPGAAWAAHQGPRGAGEKSLPPGGKGETPPGGGTVGLGETLGEMGRKLGEGLEKMGQQLEQALKSPPIQKGKSSLDETFTQMMETAFGSYRLKFTVHFPGPVLEVDSRGRQEGNTASWDFSLGTLMAGEGVVMRAMARAPFPWVPTGIAAGVVILGAAWTLARRKARQ